jgi:alcohol sulfotransferase
MRMIPGDKNNPDSYKVRRAKVGGYRDYFDDDQVQQIDSYIRANLDPVFGYEVHNAVPAASER